MTSFIRSTSEIPVPETLRGLIRAENVETIEEAREYLRSLEKHVETISRALNATAQFAWGREIASVQVAQGTSTSTSTRAASAKVNYPTPTYIQAWYSVTFEVDTAPASTEEVVAYFALDGVEVKASRSSVNLAGNWAASQVLTLNGSMTRELDRDKIYDLSLVVEIPDGGTGEITVRDTVSGFDYRLNPRAAGV